VEDLNQPDQLRWEAPRLARARGGDRAAFSEIYRAYSARLFSRVLMPKLGDRAAAEDALSETFRTAFERLDDFEERGVSLYFWLARIAANKALDLHRARGATGRAISNFQVLLAPLVEAPPDPDALLELRTDHAELAGAVGAVLTRLNPRYRRAIELRIIDELPREDCAAALEVKVGTFDVLVLRALRAFKKEWTRSVPEAETP
jgi:RNA polymerase sigma-70 factor (ECF subfamily)